MTVEVQSHPAHLPACWPHSVTFFSNLHSMFFGNELQTEVLEDHVKRLGTYGGRAIPILNLLFRGHPNLLVLEDTPDPSLLQYFQDRLQLDLPDMVVLPADVYQLFASFEEFKALNVHRETLERIASHASLRIDGFVTDSILEKLAKSLGKPTLCTSEASHQGNNKLLLHQFQEAQGMAHFETILAAAPQEVPACLRKLRERGYKRAAIKSQIGASGLGMMTVSTDESDATEIPAHLFFEGPCMVQGWLHDPEQGHVVVGSPSVQMFCNDNAVELYDLTDQILDDASVWEGNISPAATETDFPPLRDDLLSQAAIAGQWLHGQGYRGMASTDFVVVKEKRELRAIVCEINARLTGATYPSLLARHFHCQGPWLMRHLTFDPTLSGEAILRTLDESNLLYSQGDARGVLPLNFNLNMLGRVHSAQFLCLEDTRPRCCELLEEVIGLLPVSRDSQHA